MFSKYYDIFLDSFSNYWNYLFNEITSPGWHNYFYWLIGLSLLAWIIEIILPWRKEQPLIRKDFWLDAFYMFFNFFLFSLVGYNAISNIGTEAFNDLLALVNINNLVAVEISSWPKWAQLLLMFVLADFIQWNIHRLLHRVPALWQFHKLHHSVKQMGFAAHLRFHWMETIIYKSIQYIPLAMIGFSINDFFIIHIIAIAIGHLNHANVGWDYGLFKYLLNNPKMHIWHHAKKIPEGSYGVNYGLSLSIWDYIFNTVYIPKDGKDVELGFPDEETFPDDLIHQITYPLLPLKKN